MARFIATRPEPGASTGSAALQEKSAGARVALVRVHGLSEENDRGYCRFRRSSACNANSRFAAFATTAPATSWITRHSQPTERS